MNHTMTIQPYDVNYGWLGVLNPQNAMSQKEFLSYYWQKYAHQIPTYNCLMTTDFTVYTFKFSVPYEMFVSFSSRGTKTIWNQLCYIFAGAWPSCRKIRQELNKGRTWQHSQAFPRGSRKQLHISWRKVSWKEKCLLES